MRVLATVGVTAGGVTLVAEAKAAPLTSSTGFAWLAVST
jgi:hypothetical protein